VHLKGEKTENQYQKEILTQEEVKTLFEACTYAHMNDAIQQRDKAILALLYSCGLRRSEAVYLDISDILFEKERIHIRKAKNFKERFVPINPTNLEILETYLFEARPEFIKNYQTDAFLLSILGKRMGDQAMENRLKAIVEATENETIQEKKITPHTLRHSIATHLLQNKVSIQLISQFLGHTSLESTQLYTHLKETIAS